MKINLCPIGPAIAELREMLKGEYINHGNFYCGLEQTNHTDESPIKKSLSRRKTQLKVRIHTCNWNFDVPLHHKKFNFNMITSSSSRLDKLLDRNLSCPVWVTVYNDGLKNALSHSIHTHVFSSYDAIESHVERYNHTHTSFLCRIL